MLTLMGQIHDVVQKKEKNMRITISLITLCVLIPTASFASEPITAANDFWNVFVKGDVSELEKQYADKILLKAGSEFLKPNWNINKSGDRSKDLKVRKLELMKAYKSMLNKLGQKKWQSIFGAIKKDKISTKVLKNKHVLLTVKTGPGDDYIEFELALNKDQTNWLVVSEYTDY